jgi:hypothetical protein
MFSVRALGRVILLHPKKMSCRQNGATMAAETARLLSKEGIPVGHVSVGASPTLRAMCTLLKEGQFPEITEIHPGHCAIGDIWHVRALANSREACAAAVVCTVLSAADPRYVVIDAGYKTFGADALIQYREMPNFFWQGKPSFGSVQGRPDLWLGRVWLGQTLKKQNGVLMAGNLEEFIDLLVAVYYLPKRVGRRLAILSGAGGPAVAAADACEEYGLQLAELREQQARSAQLDLDIKARDARIERFRSSSRMRRTTRNTRRSLRRSTRRRSTRQRRRTSC